MRGLGALFGGLAQGYVLGTKLQQEEEREKREKERERRAGELHDLTVRSLTMDIEEKRKKLEAERALDEAGRLAYARAMGISPEDAANDLGLTPVPANPFGEKGALVTAAEARMNEAIRRGDINLAMRELQNASTLRTKFRSEEAGKALQQFKTTGDPSAIINLYNNFWPDGGKVEGVEKIVDDKGNPVYRMTVNRDGQRTVKDFTPDELVQSVAMSADPEKSLAMDLETAAKRMFTQWIYQNHPLYRPGGIEERKVKTYEDSAASLERLRTAQAEAFRALARQRDAAASGNRPLTQQERGRMSRDIANLVHKALAPTSTTEHGVKTVTEHPLKPYEAEIMSRASALVFNEGDEPNSAIYTAIREATGRLDGLTRKLQEIFAERRKPETMAELLRSLEGMGYTERDIKHAAKLLKLDPRMIDQAYAALRSSASGRIRQAPGLEPGPSTVPAPASTPGNKPTAESFFR